MVRGKTTTFIHLDDEEAKKVWVHGDAALKKIQQVHKTAIWNFFVGRASIDGVQKVKKFISIHIEHLIQDIFIYTGQKVMVYFLCLLLDENKWWWR